MSNLLFPESAKSAQSADRIRVPGRCGRGATAIFNEIVDIDCGPPGRPHYRKLRFRFRPLGKWDAVRLASAKALITDYFRIFGGFRIATDAIVRVWYDALEDFTDEEVRFAFDGKTACDPDNQFLVQVQNFPDKIAFYLEKSPSYQRRQDRQRRAARVSDGSDPYARYSPQRAAEQEQRERARYADQNPDRKSQTRCGEGAGPSPSSLRGSVASSLPEARP